MMILTPTLRRKAPPKNVQSLLKKTSQQQGKKQFLIVGCGNELRGDDAAGPLVAMTISNWQLDSVSSIAVNQLMPELIDALAHTNYAIFVESCAGTSHNHSVQIDPVVVTERCLRTTRCMAGQLSPQALLSLAKQSHRNSPQCWTIKIPTERFTFFKELSPIAKTGISQAIKTINQFMRTYRQPANE